MTAEDLIKLSLKAIGILGSGQTARQDQINDGLTILNMMIAQWSQKRMLVLNLVEATKQATGAVSYSVGPGGDFNVTRPSKITDAFVRLLNATPGSFNADFNADFNAQTAGNSSLYVDYPITMIAAREDYNRISLKGMGAFPYYGFYDSGYPLGKVYFWPVPSSLYEMHIFIKDPLALFASLTTQLNLPPEYIEPIYYNLAVRLAPTYGVEPKQVVVILAQEGLNTLRQANTQIPSLKLPSALTSNRRAYSLPTFVGKPGI